MDTVSFFRVIKSGFVNFWRNIWLSIAATSVMVITLVILCILLFLFGVTSYSINTIEQRVDVSVYLQPSVAENKALDLKAELEKEPIVREVSYVSASSALEAFKQKNQNDQLLLESLEELTENPLPATLQVKAYEFEQYPQIVELLSGPQYKDLISKINYEDNRLLIERLAGVLRLIITGGLILGLIFSFIAILVIFNTLTLTIYNRREEVEIMRLVGATNWYIRGPFITEAILYSFSATVITALFLIPFYAKVAPQLSNYLGSAEEIFNRGFYTLPYLLPALFVVALVLSIISSLLAIRRYLRV